MELATNNEDINSGIMSESWKNEWGGKDKQIQDNSPIPVDESYTDLENEILKQMNFSTN